MIKRWANGFTIVELTVVVVAIGVLAVITTLSFRNLQADARTKIAESDLNRVAAEMQKSYKNTGVYPTTIPTTIQVSPDVMLSIERSGVTTVYSGLNAVQNGVLFAQICSDLIAEGVGKGVDQGGTTNDYISGCGNWNHDSTQITGWNTRQWNTPVEKQSLVDYAANYTVSSTFHKQAQETAVKNFYTQLVSRMEMQGGTFPITSFWDYWADDDNGGVKEQSIADKGTRKAYFCAQASTNNGTTILSIDETSQVKQEAC